MFKVYTTQYIYLYHIEEEDIIRIIERYLAEEGDVMSDYDPNFLSVLSWMDTNDPSNVTRIYDFMNTYGICPSCSIKWLSR